jgi:hypothetical protein
VHVLVLVLVLVRVLVLVLVLALVLVLDPKQYILLRRHKHTRWSL